MIPILWARSPEECSGRWVVSRTAYHPRVDSPRQVANRLRMNRRRWIPVRERLPKPGMVNGFHATVGVIALSRGTVYPCYFSFQGGDDLYPGVIPVLGFHTDEGCFLPEVTHWMPLPRGMRS